MRHGARAAAAAVGKSMDMQMTAIVELLEHRLVVMFENPSMARHIFGWAARCPAEFEQ
jgi:hypothetical protein